MFTFRYSSLAVPSTISLALLVLDLVSLIVQLELPVTVRDASLWLIRTITVCRYENQQTQATYFYLIILRNSWKFIMFIWASEKRSKHIGPHAYSQSATHINMLALKTFALSDRCLLLRASSC